MSDTHDPLTISAAVAVPSDLRRRSLALPQKQVVRWRRALRRALLLVIGVAAVGGLIFLWLPEPVPADLATAGVGTMQVMLEEDGRTRVKDRFVVSSPLVASVARLELHPGDRVEPGQLLAHLTPLDPPLLDTRSRALQGARVAAAATARDQANNAVARVETALEYARAEAARERALQESGASAERLRERAELEVRTLTQELASTRFAARIAEYEVQMARLALDHQRGSAAEQLPIVSPVAGQVLRVLQESAGVVQPGSPLIELGDLSALEVVVDVLTSDAVSIRPGAHATIEHWGGTQPIAARVRSVEPSAFTRVSALGVEEQRVNVVLDLSAPRAEWAALGDGFRVETRIVVWSGTDVLSVPESAVFRQRDQWATFVVRDGRAHLVPLVLGQRNGERVEILKGLHRGAHVILHPGERVNEGARIDARGQPE